MKGGGLSVREGWGRRQRDKDREGKRKRRQEGSSRENDFHEPDLARPSTRTSFMNLSPLSLLSSALLTF